MGPFASSVCDFIFVIPYTSVVYCAGLWPKHAFHFLFGRYGDHTDTRPHTHVLRVYIICAYKTSFQRGVRNVLLEGHYVTHVLRKKALTMAGGEIRDQADQKKLGPTSSRRPQGVSRHRGIHGKRPLGVWRRNGAVAHVD